MSELERELRGLGGEIAFPATPELGPPVGARLRAAAAPPRRLRPAFVALAAVVLALGAALVVPPARSALLDLLGIGGAAIERVETQPVAPEDADLALGERIELEDASRAVAFRVALPAASTVRAYVERSIPGGKLSFVWREGGRRLLLSEFRGEQLPYVQKSVGPDTRLESLTVDGAAGAWIEGAGHVVVWRDASGRIREETRRLAGSVLLWERDGVTYRLEGALGREHALALARSLR